MGWIKRLFCKHEKRWCTDLAAFYADTGELWPATCARCGHVRWITGKQFIAARDGNCSILAARDKKEK